jgi:membrane protein YdbS with pleckstrin-like domain/DNA-directed RNA polymerase subunit RPC12/RpoP
MTDIRFNCHECGGNLSVDENGAGMTVSCPLCSKQVRIPSSQETPIASPSSPPIAKEKGMVNCSFCGEEILTTAIKCKHCGEFLDGRNIPKPVTPKPKQKVLTENELWRGNPSYLYYLLHFIFGIALIFPFGLGLVFIIYAVLDRNTKVFVLTNKRVTAKTGIIARNVHEVGIRDIRSINVKQGIIERLFGLGAVEIASAGTAGVEVRFSGIKNPITIRDMVRRQKDEAESE